LNFSAVRPGIYCVKFTKRVYLEDGRADGTNEGTLDTSGEFAVVPPEAITVGSSEEDELGEIEGIKDGRDNCRLDGTDEGDSVGSSLGVSLGFRLGNVDVSTDGTDDGRDDGPLVASDGLVEGTWVGSSVGHELGKIGGIDVGSLVGITDGSLV